MYQKPGRSQAGRRQGVGRTPALIMAGERAADAKAAPG